MGFRYQANRMSQLRFYKHQEQGGMRLTDADVEIVEVV